MSLGWALGFTLAIVVVLVVVALVLPILVLAYRIGQDAAAIDASLRKSVTHTAELTQLHTTIDHANVIVAGLGRGRARLGG